MKIFGYNMTKVLDFEWYLITLTVLGIGLYGNWWWSIGWMIFNIVVIIPLLIYFHKSCDGIRTRHARIMDKHYPGWSFWYRKK